MNELWLKASTTTIAIYVLYSIMKEVLVYFKSDNNNANNQQSELINIIAEKISKQSDSIHELAVALTQNNKSNEINNQNQSDNIKDIKESVTSISSKTDRILSLVEDIKNKNCQK